jgi:S-adenosylmethionine hydrolase
MLAAEAGGMRFVGPDNGLLPPAAEAVAGAGGVAWRAVTRAELWLPGPGATFHGRDRFAPAAAWLLAGGALADLGPAVADPVRLPLPAPRRDGAPGAAGTVLTGRVAWIDRFGNLVTDLPAEWLGDRPFRAEVAGRATARRAGHYREIPPGEAALLPGSLGTLELALDGDSLARRWRVARGAAVTVRLD